MLQLFHQLIAVHARHHDINDCKVDLIPLHDFVCSLSVIGFDDTDIFLFEKQFENCYNFFFIVGNQDARLITHEFCVPS